MPNTEVDAFLEHYGVLGMHWGVRRGRGAAAKAPASSDAAKANTLLKKAKTEGTHTLSNEDLKHLTTRLNLEQQYSRLMTTEKSTVDKGHAFVKEVIGAGKTGVDAYNTYNQVKKILEGASTK